MTLWQSLLQACLRFCIFGTLLLAAQAQAQQQEQEQEQEQQPIINIVIAGVNEELEANIRLFLSIEQQKGHPLLSRGRIERLHAKAPEEIAAALKPYGYYQSSVESSAYELQPDVWEVIYSVDTGPGIPIAEFKLNVDGEMRNDPELEKMVAVHGLRVGAIFVHPQYDSLKSRVREIAADRGYMQGEFTEARVEINLNDYEANVQLDFDSGKRYSFGEIVLDQEVLNEDFLRRYITFAQGDPFDFDQVTSLKRALIDSNYFQYVEVSPGDPLHETMEIPVTVRLTPRKRHRYDFGVGYGTDTGARAKVGWRIPRVNKRGHRFDSEVVVSEIGYNAVANYRVPVYNPRTDQLVYTARQKEEDTDSNESRLRLLGISLNHNRGDWREVLSLNYEYEDFEVASDEGTSNLVIPGVSWSRIWGGDFINVVDGLRFDIGLRGASDEFISDTSFLQMRGGAKFIVSVDPRNRFLLRGNFGITETPDFHQLPSSIRFFAGGSQSVRGYAYEALGPKDSKGDVKGGKGLVTSSVEFEHYFNDRWGAAVFLDSGNAIDSLSDDFEQGAGFGLRWKSPIGPMRVDLANSISRGKSWRLHINLGPDL